jgi:hypothetical protein
MPRIRRTLAALVTATTLVGVPAAVAEPLFKLSDDGRTFLYRARPGDHPGIVAEMFGIPTADVPAFLAANGITDPTRVDAGFTYRIPNAAARALSDRVSALEQENARLARASKDDRARANELARGGEEARAVAAGAEQRAAALERIAQLWPWAKTGLIALLLVTAAAVSTALAALRRHGQAQRFARGLARELEDKRRVALAERQESAKRIVDLESRVRALEGQLGPRVLISGRGS